MVEGYVQTQADACQFVHTTTNGTMTNLYYVGYSDGHFQAAADVLAGALESWFGELATLGQDSLTISATNYNHFTLMTWGETQEIACAVNDCPAMPTLSGTNLTFVVCAYSNPAGNMMGSQIYATGAPCSACTNTTTCDPTVGLCVSNDTSSFQQTTKRNQNCER